MKAEAEALLEEGQIRAGIAGSMSTGFSFLDIKLGGFRPGQSYLLAGGKGFAEHFIYRSMIENISLFGREILFIDCGNSLNPFTISQMCREKGIGYQKVLERILISRPFTAYQLNTLFEEGLLEALDRRPSMVVFSNFLSLFRSEDIEKIDADIILKRMLGRLKVGACPLILTHSSGRRKHLEETAEAIDTFITLVPLRNQGMRTRIEKDPILLPQIIEYKHKSNTQKVLPDFMEVS